MATANTHAPLSLYAKHHLNIASNVWMCFIFWILFTLFGMFIPVVVLTALKAFNVVRDPGEFLLVGFCVINLLSLPIATMFIIRESRKDVLENKADYERSLKLRKLWENKSTLTLQDLRQVDDEIVGCWQPFRVEHFVTSSLQPNHHWRPLTFLPWTESCRDLIPNLIDTSTILFLRSPHGTLRLLLPCAPATLELLKPLLRRHGHDIEFDTHTGAALREFFSLRQKLSDFLSHAQLIDSLDAMCRRPMGPLPDIRVYGQFIEPGIAIGTQIVVNSETAVFLPARFLDALSGDIGQIIEPPAKAPLVFHPAA